MAATVVVLAWHTATETTLRILLSHLMLSSVGLDGGYCRGAGMAHFLFPLAPHTVHRITPRSIHFSDEK